MAGQKSDIQSLAERLDTEVEEMIEDMKKKNPDYKYEDGFTEDNIDHILRTHPAFMTDQPTQEDIDESPLLYGLQQLKYEDDEDTPEEKALAYKEDGNWHFKHKLYFKAVKAYTEGLNKRCSDRSLNSILFANRAAANFYLKNYRSSINDSIEALKLEPTKMKSLLRCAQCCEALEKYSDALLWTKKILELERNNEQALELIKRAQNGIKVTERNKRKREKEERMKNMKMRALVDAVKSRGIRLNLTDLKPSNNDVLSVEDSLILQSVDCSNPSHAKVHFEDDTLKNLGENGKLVWPVLLTYPEHEVSEIIEEFTEDVTFLDHLEVMFEEKAPWDADGTYRLENLEMYHEIGNEGLQHVPTLATLVEVLSTGLISVKAGTPMFIVLSRASPFRDIFLSKHKVC